MENLNLLEDRLNRLIEHFTRLKEERNVLEQRLGESSGRMRDLEGEVAQLQQERDVIRERLSRLIATIERLETLETATSEVGV
jgi:FtsZ-binding cell division protein ZapB